MRLDGRRVLITGAARGIGRHTATVMAELGADVALFDRDKAVVETAEQVRGMGRDAAHRLVDVADHAAVFEAVAGVEAELGPVDALVNNAGITTNIAPLERMSPEKWQLELGVNLTGAFNTIQAVVGGMAERGWGRIVNVSSAAAGGGLHSQVGYASTKAGLLGLTRNVTVEYAGRGVTCNAILPGMIATEKVLAMPKEIFDQAVRQCPTGRAGDPGEVAHLIAFLCSETAGYINGVDILIDGGAAMNSVVLGSRRALRGRED